MAICKIISWLCLFSLLISNIATFNVGTEVQVLQVEQNTELPNLDIISDLDTYNPSFDVPFSGFLMNHGQLSNSGISYYFNSPLSSVGFGKSYIILKYSESIQVQISFPNSNLVHPIGKDELYHKTNYFIGNTQITNIASFQEIWYHNIYDKIDLRYYMTEKGLKYDFIVLPGGNPNQIRLKASDSIDLDVFSDQILFKSQGLTEFKDTDLFVYQGTTRHKIQSHFRDFGHNKYGFQIGDYDESQNLVIDPLYLGFSTYLGGNDADDATDVKVDNTGIYVIGSTGSTDFNTTNEYQTDQTSLDIFVMKLNSTDYSIIFSTYLGGDGLDNAGDFAIDSQGNLYLTGSTQSTDFPTLNQYQTNTDTDSNTNSDIFVTKLNSTGNGLNFSTYIGGSDHDYGKSIAINSTGNVIVLGETLSNDYPTVNPNMTVATVRDVVVTKLSSQGSSVVFSTYLGGNGDDFGSSIVINADEAYIVGYTASTDYPTGNSYMTEPGDGNTDVFVTRLNSTGNGFNFSTYLGGSLDDFGYGIALDTSANVYVVGSTASTDFPTNNPYMSDPSDSNTDAFVTKLNETGNGLIFSTYFGGNNQETVNDLVVDSSNNVFFTGFTGSDDYPVLDYNMTDPGDTNLDAVVTGLNSTGNGLLVSSYIGGDNADEARDIAMDSIGDLYISGYSSSLDYPTVDPFMTDPSDTNTDAFVTKLIFDVIAPSDNDPSDFSVEIGNASSVNWTLTDLHSGNYDLYVNGSLSFANISWTSGIEISIPITLLTKANYNYTIVYRDLLGNEEIDTVIVTVVDTVDPTIIPLADFDYEFGTGNSEFSWVALDFDPETFVLFRNGTQILTANWEDNTPINVSLSSLQVGYYNFTIVVSDSSGNSDFDIVIVHLIDSYDPIINSPADKSAELGEFEVIPWTIQDLNPDHYEVYQNGTLVESTSWNANGSINFNLADFERGFHNFTLVAVDGSGRSTSDTVIVSITDTTAPVLSSPPDESILAESTGNVLTWTPTDADNGTYVIFVDDIETEGGNWISGEDIEFSIDGLSPGQHEIVIVVTDNSGNSVTDTVIITVTTSTDDNTQKQDGPLGFIPEIPFDRETLILIAFALMILIPVLLMMRGGKKEEEDYDYY